MNLLNPSKPPKPVVNHNCQTWFPYGYPWKGQYNERGDWVASNTQITLAKQFEVWKPELTKAKEKALKASVYDRIKKKLGAKEFVAKQLEVHIESPFGNASQLINYASHKNEIKITGGNGQAFKYRFVQAIEKLTDNELLMTLKNGFKGEFDSKQAVVLLSGFAAPNKVRKLLNVLVLQGQLQCENKKYFFN